MRRKVDVIEGFPVVKVLKYLRLLGKDFRKEGAAIVVREVVEGKEVDVRIYFQEPWVRIAVPLGRVEDFPAEKREALLRLLLEMTYNFFEISVGVNEEGEIFALEDILQQSLTLDVFEEEYHACVEAVKVFREEVVEKLGGVSETGVKGAHSST